MKTLIALFLFLATAKEPIVIEATTKHKNTEEALQATKTILLAEKFITQEMQKKGFTATRTTGAKADYFVADVTASEADGKVKVTISFVKVGTGLLNLKKVAERVKEKLEE
ncbi:hypothetical protein [Chitinophaga niabensis]|uniref:Uncharacterized protein n=1 Tax=Chitinophaga niabensis TaxID=536979 RepID=A0A1N6K454_9BACT|nr:hypothetical protein [Chitinophaga niabensis]SIO51335.1 hypothetical protein SAMN04488055_5040 [Chitinophaga niabensis]